MSALMAEPSARPISNRHPSALSALKDGGNALAATHAHGLEAIADLSALHLMHQTGHDPHACCANRMTERNAGTIDVQDRPIIPVPTFENSKHLRSKGFIELNKTHVAPRKACLGEQLVDGRNGANPHARRLAPGRCPTDEEGRGI